MGIDPPNLEDVAIWAKHKSKLADAVIEVVGDMMESESMLSIFVEEAEGFMSMMVDKTDEDIYKTWPAKHGIIEACSIE